MAVKIDPSSKIVLKVVTGTDASGKDTTAQRTVNKLNPSLSDDKALVLGTYIAGLQANTLSSVSRTDSAILE